MGVQWDFMGLTWIKLISWEFLGFLLGFSQDYELDFISQKNHLIESDQITMVDVGLVQNMGNILKVSSACPRIQKWRDSLKKILSTSTKFDVKLQVPTRLLLVWDKPTNLCQRECCRPLVSKKNKHQFVFFPNARHQSSIVSGS